ncbi:2-dehydropantoate 2-reductase [Marinimicrococcus flavescens]|uniref:2-dehydropantoate 2-reductase n=1 Tax=Marinimicrococcus flavescens TaxID=3031815 RepID=A0AAP3XSN2_9PROT|nr:2-dehydropantoate 2-reductase [Marinimicrococcus flavescens]
MRICVYGAGAIGGLLGARLARSGVDVSLVARGPHLAAIREKGLSLESGAERFTVYPQAAEDPASFGPQDYVIVALKAHQVPGVVERLQPLLGPKTAVVLAVNGVPWWYFHAIGGELEGRRLASVDPGDVQWNGIGPERAIGCVVYPAAEVAEPGLVRLVDGDRFSLGEPSGERTERVTRLAEAFVAAGFKAPVRPRLRDEIWVKLWGNLSFNPISALTCATLEQICADEGTRAVARAMMLEAREIGLKLGVRFAVDVDRRIEGAAAVGAHKTSMLQDLERGRALETDALVTAVQEMGRLVGLPTPSIDLVAALLRLRARTAGCA